MGVTKRDFQVVHIKTRLDLLGIQTFRWDQRLGRQYSNLNRHVSTQEKQSQRQYSTSSSLLLFKEKSELLFLTFRVLVANPKKTYTVANPARGLLNREKRKSYNLIECHEKKHYIFCNCSVCTTGVLYPEISCGTNVHMYYTVSIVVFR